MAEEEPTPAEEVEQVEEVKEAKSVETTDEPLPSAAAAEETHEETAEEKVVRKDKERKHRRMKALNELVSTEETYNYLLGLLLTNYVLPLQDYAVLTEEHYKCLFPSIGILKGLSDKFLEDLKTKVSTWDPETSLLSDMFKSFAHFFKMYQTYVNNYDRAVELMGKIESRKVWVEYMAAVRPACDGFNLASLLILPVQRIPRYNLLLGEVLRHTMETHADFTGLKQARTDVKAVSMHINDQMKQSEKNEAVRKIERLFTTKVRLLEAARVFIRKGKLWKVCRSKDRVYHFFLFSDLLLYASSYGTKMNLHNSLNVDAAFSVSWVDDAKYGEIKGRAFQIVSSKKSFVAYAGSPKEAQEWFEDLQKAANKAREIMELRGHAAGESVAVWVPDAHADKCSMDDCDRKFTIVHRRHHCRKCGVLVCSQCSKFKLPNAEGVMQRACKRCYFGDMGEAGALPSDTSSREESAMDDDSSEDEFQAETNVLQEISFYIESEGELTVNEIFAKFGRGDGSYCLMPTVQGDDFGVGVDQYLVQLHVYSSGKVKSFDVGLVNKKRGIEFRLNKKKKQKEGGTSSILKHKSKGFKDYISMKQLIEHIQKKEKIVFSYAIPRMDVYNSLVRSSWGTGAGDALHGPESELSKSATFDEAMLQATQSGVNPFASAAGNLTVRDLDLYPTARALYDYEADVVGDLNLRAGEVVYIISKEQAEGWWTGLIPGAEGDPMGERKGLFPSTYVECLEPHREVPKGKNEPQNGEVLVARYTYADASKEELSFETGDRIVLMDKDPTGWWLGQLQKTGAVGWFAPDLTQPQSMLGTHPTEAGGGGESESPATASPKTAIRAKSIDDMEPKKAEATEDGADVDTWKAAASTVPEVGGGGGKGKPPPSGGKKKRKPPPRVLKSASYDTTAVSEPKPELESAPVAAAIDLVIPLADILARDFDKSTVNAKQLEDYLSDEDFIKVFGMDRARFKSSPKWKQVRMKKDRRLF